MRFIGVGLGRLSVGAEPSAVRSARTPDGKRGLALEWGTTVCDSSGNGLSVYEVSGRSVGRGVGFGSSMRTK